MSDIYNFAEEAIYTEEDKRQLNEKLRRAREYAPSSRVQTDSYRYFQESQSALLGAPYDVSKIPIDVLTQMKFDPMLMFGEHFITMPLLRARWHIESEDAQVAAFVDRALRKIYGNYILERSQSHIYGFKPIVKRFQLEMPDWRYKDPAKSDMTLPVWDSENVEALTWKHFVGLPSNPSICEPMFTAKGDFNGIQYSPMLDTNADGLSGQFNFTQVKSENDGSRKVPAHLALWAVNQRHTVDGSLWGFPRIGYAYRYWFSYWLRWAMYDRYFERKSDPPYVVYYPNDPLTGEVDSDGVSMKTHALAIGDAAKSGGTIALPGDFSRGWDDRPTGNREWEVKELEIAGDLGHFVESFEYLDKMKLRALLIPDQALMGAGGAASNRNAAEQEIDMFMASEASEMEQIDDEINRYVIPDIVAANFPDRNVTATKVTTGFDDADIDTMMEIIRVVGQSDQNALKAVDFEGILDAIGIPSIGHDEIVRREEKIKEEIANANPEPIQPVPGEQAGIDEEGFYIQPKEVIRLAEENFAQEFPATKHYEDEDILDIANRINTEWSSVYSDIYNDIASFISTAEFSENEDSINLADDEAKKLAERILDGWNLGAQKTQSLIDRTTNRIKEIIERAGRRELERIRTNPDWQPDTDTVAEYLEERGALYVKAVSDTVKNEVASYLAEQIRQGKSNQEISQGIREHFQEFPGWKADRLVRSEVRDAYNFATLEAGQQAGIKVVQAKDAQLGDTDAECIERNNQFYSIPQALVETLREHPFGTLEWKLIPNVDSIQEVVVGASELEGEEIGYFDQENDTIYFNEEATEYEVAEFRSLLGEMLFSE